jgi:hypothetical protein
MCYLRPNYSANTGTRESICWIPANLPIFWGLLTLNILIVLAFGFLENMHVSLREGD